MDLGIDRNFPSLVPSEDLYSDVEEDYWKWDIKEEQDQASVHNIICQRLTKHLFILMKSSFGTFLLWLCIVLALATAAEPDVYVVPLRSGNIDNTLDSNEGIVSSIFKGIKIIKKLLPIFRNDKYNFRSGSRLSPSRSSRFSSPSSAPTAKVVDGQSTPSTPTAADARNVFPAMIPFTSPPLVDPKDRE